LRPAAAAGVARTAAQGGGPIELLLGEAGPRHASERTLRDGHIGMPANDGDDSAAAAIARTIDAKLGAGLRRAG